MARIRFLSDQIFERDGIGKGPFFRKGSVLDSDAVAAALDVDHVTRDYALGFLNRWVQRGVAIIVADDAVDEPDGEVSEEAGKAEEGSDLSKLKREELDAKAVEKGIDPAAHKTKADLIAAIEAASQA